MNLVFFINVKRVKFKDVNYVVRIFVQIIDIRKYIIVKKIVKKQKRKKKRKIQKKKQKILSVIVLLAKKYKNIKIIIKFLVKKDLFVDSYKKGN